MGEHLLKFPVEHGFLVGVLPVTQRPSALKITVDGGVVMGRDLKTAFRKQPAHRFIRRPFTCFQNLQQVIVIGFGRAAKHILEIFGGGTNQGNAADVDFFNDFSLIVGLGQCFLKRIEVHHHQIDGRNMVLLRLLDILRFLPPVEDAAHDARMQCLHTASKNGGVAGNFFNICRIYSIIAQIPVGSSG